MAGDIKQLNYWRLIILYIYFNKSNSKIIYAKRCKRLTLQHFFCLISSMDGGSAAFFWVSYGVQFSRHCVLSCGGPTVRSLEL